MSERSRTTTPLTYVAHLDGLRAVAVVMVIAAHMPYVAGSALSKAIWIVVQDGRTGYVGVDLFFVLSGFLITRILLHERVETGQIRLFAFYGRRMLRIFPIYYLSLAVTAATFHADPGATESLLFYTFNYYHVFHSAPYPMEHAWSLAVEEQFYLLWPLALALLPLRWGRVITGLAVPAVAVLSAVTFAVFFDPTVAAALIYNALPTRMLSLSLGAYLAFREFAGAPVSRRRSLGLLAAGGAALGLDAAGRATGLISSGGAYWCIALAAYGVLAYGTVAVVLMQPPAWLKAALSTSGMRTLGRMSYGLYLYHLILLFALGINPAKLTGGTSLSRLLVAIALTFALASLSYRFIERPLLRLKSREVPLA